VEKGYFCPGKAIFQKQPFTNRKAATVLKLFLPFEGITETELISYSTK
jgi:hypothetical protein